MLDKHPWSAHAYTGAKTFLPALERGVFDVDVIALPDQFIDEPSMQTLAVGSQFAAQRPPDDDGSADNAGSPASASVAFPVA